jgi:hypothetical protein
VLMIALLTMQVDDMIGEHERRSRSASGVC